MKMGIRLGLPFNIFKLLIYNKIIVLDCYDIYKHMKPE